MELKKICIKKFTYKNIFGEYYFKDIEIEVDKNNTIITDDSCDLGRHEYFLSDKMIEKMEKDSVERFLNKNSKKLRTGEISFSKEQLYQVLIFLHLNQSDFSKLLGKNKSSVTRMLMGEIKIEKNMAISIMNIIKQELNKPGHSKNLLKAINKKKLLIKPLHNKAISIAEYFVKFFKNKNEETTALKLQKLLYYAQGVGLSHYNFKLFEDPILAWKLGPVVEKVYYEYKKNLDYKSNANLPILGINTSKLEACKDSMLILEKTISYYGGLTAYALAEKTHNESPWLETEQNKVIEEKKIITFFQNSEM
ncbi:MAG: DUF4065 domain-containing protein [Bdellovibrionales bacterium]|nr:DUF4065 domain-containing protein [Bdellovibrionales bacterium]